MKLTSDYSTLRIKCSFLTVTQVDKLNMLLSACIQILKIFTIKIVLVEVETLHRFFDAKTTSSALHLFANQAYYPAELFATF